jgi:phage/conjugal plasmid C-4 type zinc finger TraR family protein
MADAADRAAEREFYLRQEALARALATRPVTSQTGQSRHTCEECGTTIPQARRAAVPGVRLCVACQTELEQQ